MNNNFFNGNIETLKGRELGYHINKMQDGDLQSHQKVINHYICLIKKMVERNCLEDEEDLLSCGIIGMLKAINIYYKENDNHLTTMVVSYAQKEIDRYLKLTNKENKIKEMIYNDMADVITDYEDKEKKDILIHAIDMLPYPDNIIIKLHFGIDFTKPYTQYEIADMFNFSKTRMNQMFLRALVRLRNILELQLIKPVGKSGKTKSFYKLFQGYTIQQVKNALTTLDKERLDIISYLYVDEYDVAIQRWNELEEKTKIEFYRLVDEIRVELKKQNKCKQKRIK